jgi:hypothetical protein
LQDRAATGLIDVSLYERAGVEVRPHGYARSSRSSMTVRDSGLPLTLTGRQLGVGIGPFRAAGVIKPSSMNPKILPIVLRRIAELKPPYLHYHTRAT